ncbi:MAG: homocysteine S-methyltransferase family protein [Candidatus Pelagibacter sp.]|nr:homocysteine S-methyltransferase family protein [Candidatus Pelagibacter sp.]
MVKLLSAPYGSAIAKERHELGDNFRLNEVVKRVMSANVNYADIVMGATFGARNILREQNGIEAYRNAIRIQAELLMNSVGFDRQHGFFLGPFTDDCYLANGVVHPKVNEAKEFHGEQLSALEYIDGLPWFEAFPTINDAKGAALAAKTFGKDVAINFVVSDNGNLRSGESVTDAIRACESVSGGFVRYYGVNCCSYEGAKNAFLADKTGLLNVFYLNASDQDPSTLEGSCEVVKEDISLRISQILGLIESYPRVQVVGGCCGFEIEDLELLSRQFRR